MGTSKKTKFRALVVDDDETVTDHVTQMLHRLNFDVEQSFDGLDALRRCQSARYDIVLCDVRMPRLSGLSLLTNLGQTPNADTRIVMISALDDDALRKQALASGAVAYLVKPLTEDMLRDALGDDFATQADPT
ncbi:MAG: response regulator [Betaproteobacteria bacterium]|nr:response regulator [Betaproteobacteria bacterium]